MDSDGDDRPNNGKGKGKGKEKERRKEKEAGGDKKLAKALDSLSGKQLADLLALNPALQQEMLTQATATDDPSTTDVTTSSSSVPVGAAEPKAGAKPDVSSLLKQLQLQDIVTGMATSGKNAKDMASYQFWKTQPVPKFGESGGLPDGPLQVKTVDEVPKEPSPLLDGFEWVTMDLTKDAEMTELYELLNGHYVEDVNAMFRFDYSTPLLQWALMSPGWSKDWHVGVRAATSRKLLAFISAVPMRVRVRDAVITCAEVNFLCVHKKLRSKRLAPVLIKEITRRANLVGVWQGVYTGGVLLPSPVSTCRYFHRAINWQKLFDMGFAPLPSGSKPAYQVRKYAMPSRPSLKGFREMKPSDAPEARDLVGRYLKRFDMAPEFDEGEFNHWLVNRAENPKDKVIWAYVVENSDKKITDFMSFYRLESSVINKNSKIRTAYLFYYATETGLATPFDRSALKTRLFDLFNDTCIVAAAAKFDVFNALSLSDNALFLEDSKFRPGDGSLHYYLFNYRTKPIAGGIDKSFDLDKDKLSGIGLVML